MKQRLAGSDEKSSRRAWALASLVVFLAAALPAALAVAAASPAVTTGDVSSVSNSSAILHGTVDPNGAETHYSFQWGLTKAYGSSSPLKSAGAGSTSVPVQFKARGLLPGTTYHYRLVASSRAGATNGNDRTFKTAGHPPPAAVTGPVAKVGRRSATLTGVVFPHGAATTFLFQYGTTTGYGSQTFAGVVGKGKPAQVSQRIGGLSPGTVFHYRIVALHNGAVAGYGADAIFVTFPLHRSRAHLRAKVSPRKDTGRPFRFLTHGTLAGISPTTASSVCPGTVAVTFSWHGQRIARHLIPVARNCTFKGRTTLRHLPRALMHRHARLTVRIRFIGNGYLRPAQARGVHVSIG
jgi:hypothetical protein